MRSRAFMRNALLAFSFLQIFVPNLASPLLRHEVEEVSTDLSHGLRRRQASDGTVAINGIQAYGIQPRLEVRQLEQNADQWNIFLLGLRLFQMTDQTNQTSYYQIAGIHGRPYIPWDGVPAAEGINSPGYCLHLSNLFLTWHRPYLALFEQTLYQHIVDAVNQFPAGTQRQQYAEAALTWRLPYWDWAAPPPSGQSVFPTSLQSPTVDVIMPNGSATIPNPLYSYQFQPVSATDFYFNPFATWNQTMRYPTSWDEDATSQDELLGPVFDNNRISFQDRLYNLFTNYDNFTEFGNEAWMGPGISNADSLESIHDAIHSIMGSNGHMTYLDYSAFDPSFWLHHAMIDRCFALWQALYPDSYVEPMAAIEQAFTVTVGEVEDDSSALEPFFSDDARDYWTASSVRSLTTFGYTYPELAGDVNTSAVKAAINELYGSSAGSSGISKRGLNAPSTLKREIPTAISDVQDGPSNPDETKQWQYLANILSQKFALNGSYAVYLFIGDFDQDPSTWATSPNLVGTHAVFAALSGVDASSNPQGKAKRSSSPIQVTGSMPLTTMLMAKTASDELSSLEPDVVADYLTENLSWRVGTFDGSEVPVEDVADLSVTIISAEVEPASSIDQFPQWSNFTKLTSITHGKLGGC